jgi:sugar/nucleoside kinase (ribokinase family)
VSNNVVIVGSVAYDDVETPHGARKDMLGGSATYFSVSASRFTNARLVGVVGNDFAEHDRKLLTDHEVDISGMVTDTSGDSFRWGGRYHENMNDRTTLYTHLNVFERFQPAIPETYQDERFIFLGNIDPALQLDVLDQMTGPQFVALDTMNFWIEGPRRSYLDQVLKRVDGLIVNDEEAKLLTNGRSILDLGRQLQEIGPRTVIVKRGEHGALLFHGDDIFFTPGYPVEKVIDPTGAGDTFAGGFMGYVARRGDLSIDTMKGAMLCGSVMASFCVEGFGLERLSKITTDDIKNRCTQFEALTRCPALTL